MVSRTRDKTEPSQADAYRVWAVMGQVNDGLVRIRDKEVRPLGVSAAQIALLQVLLTMHRRGMPARPSELSRWLYREHSTIMSLLSRMEKDGLVRLVRSSSGRRQVLVEATDKAREVTRRDMERTMAMQKVLGRLSVRERSQLESILEKLRKATFEELSEEPPYP